MWPQTNKLPHFSPSLPAAQEWSADLNRTLSRREKKKAADGVTLTGINQTGDQALQNKPSRWVLQQPPSPGIGPPVLCVGRTLPAWAPGRLPSEALQGTPQVSFQMFLGYPNSAGQWPKGISGEDHQLT